MKEVFCDIEPDTNNRLSKDTKIRRLNENSVRNNFCGGALFGNDALRDEPQSSLGLEQPAALFDAANAAVRLLQPGERRFYV